ncbi:electron transport complex protein RnfG [Aequitasia blattaphilus]|uniref:Ion-translocating oxidoreductase complex subunit G n=1 Tax=Aequitasia blattaphilus TaxID=2949332 RepID=A0ABT1E8C5_9FIRM|nr:RnfABCDGE type electron transport complex subunit G [Aequitasia blattaphilus]MCP1101121.1 RnfABCDGE type electron transport complex subunit G [Aequitasia blattaphilus]MCR8613761.1 RnfABCDGE type electron transport complex subunit G [Aequitasia blattaphilus]
MKMWKNAIILTLITVIAGAALGLVYEVTKEPIANAQDKAKRDAWVAVFPDAKVDEFQEEKVDEKAADSAISDTGANAIVDEVCTVGDKGYVVTVTDKNGYGGDIKITVGLTKEGEVSGISFLSISETAGLGMKAKEPKFYEQFVGKTTAKFAVKKDGGDGEPIEALSGATITSRAVTEAVNVAIAYCGNAF